MSYLEVPGASLYYEVAGQGPMLLCITGAIGNVEPFRGLAECLKDYFTVVLYDRRGFSRSHLSTTEAQDYNNRIQTDADDAARLISDISPETPVTVLASSIGAVVGLELLVRHPDAIRFLLPHEPPASTLLHDCDEITAKVQRMYEEYRRHGMPSALQLFGELTNIGPIEGPFLMEAFNTKNSPFVFSDAQYWFEREILYYPVNRFDMNALEKVKGKLILAVGEMSNPEALHYRANVVLSEKLGLELVKFPGAHLGLASHPQQFAERLVEALQRQR